jgi:hypothetical protein
MLVEEASKTFASLKSIIIVCPWISLGFSAGTKAQPFMDIIHVIQLPLRIGFGEKLNIYAFERNITVELP